MTKQKVLEYTGTVIEVLPNALFRVELDGEEWNGTVTILCHISGKMRKNHINILMDDLVHVEMSKYDMTKGRIVFREKR